MRWLLWRELTVMTRTRAIWIAMCGYVVLLACFIVIWGDGVPVMSGSVFEQFTTFQFALLVCMLPWAAARCMVGDRNGIALLAAVTGRAPRDVVITRCLAVGLVLFATGLSGMPLNIIALRIARADAWSGIATLTVASTLCAFVAAIVTLNVVLGAGRLAAWLMGMVATVVVLVASHPAERPVLLLIGAAALTWAATVYANRSLRYVRFTVNT